MQVSPRAAIMASRSTKIYLTKKSSKHFTLPNFGHQEEAATASASAPGHGLNDFGGAGYVSDSEPVPNPVLLRTTSFSESRGEPVPNPVLPAVAASSKKRAAIALEDGEIAQAIPKGKKKYIRAYDLLFQEALDGSLHEMFVPKRVLCEVDGIIVGNCVYVNKVGVVCSEPADDGADLM